MTNLEKNVRLYIVGSLVGAVILMIIYALHKTIYG